MDCTMGSQVACRFMRRQDMYQVLEIENRSFPSPWQFEDFIHVLQQRNGIGLVATDRSDMVIGYVLYELHERHIHLLNFAIDTTSRRSGIGSQLLNAIKQKMSCQRTTLQLEISESNLAAQLFFKSQGFKAIKVLRQFYDESDEDAYLMRFRFR